MQSWRTFIRVHLLKHRFLTSQIVMEFFPRYRSRPHRHLAILADYSLSICCDPWIYLISFVSLILSQICIWFASSPNTVRLLKGLKTGILIVVLRTGARQTRRIVLWKMKKVAAIQMWRGFLPQHDRVRRLLRSRVLCLFLLVRCQQKV